MAPVENLQSEHDIDGDAPQSTGPQTAADVGPEVARAGWAVAAREVLIKTAGKYNAVVTHKELSAGVQSATGITTTQLAHYWMGDVLGRVSIECERLGEPNLAALCVKADGSVGEAYAAAVETASGARPADADDHAAQQRLACYQRYEASGLPEGGGLPALTPQVAASRARTRKAAIEARPIVTCATCNMAIPPTGLCDNCD